MIEARQEYASSERRAHKRIPAAGSIAIKAYFSTPADEPRSKDQKEFYNISKYYTAVDGTGDLVDAGFGGIQIVTALVLDRDCLIEVNNAGVRMALVRWVEKSDRACRAGLMYL